jgi:hypothetical protein
MAFLTTKEKSNWELSLKLQYNRIIIEPSLPFQASNKKEINSLLIRGVFAFKQFNKAKHKGNQIFKSRIVYKVKGKTTPILFKKLYLII